MKSLFIATHNSDMTEGRGYITPVGIFEKVGDAREAIKGWGVMGVGNGEVYNIPLFESLDEYEQFKDKYKWGFFGFDNKVKEEK